MTEDRWGETQDNKILDGETQLEKNQQEAYEELHHDMETLRRAIHYVADCYADKGVTYDFLLQEVKEYL